MAIRDLLLTELDYEAVRTRNTLERVPNDKPDFQPHAKSAKLGKLAAHVAQLGGFGLTILTTPSLDFATAGMKPLAFESAAQLVRECDANLAKVGAELGKMKDEAWQEAWQLSMGDRVFFSGSRFTAYRAMFLNHMVHHRAQLGIYLRLLGVPVPSIYGPSADEQ